MDMGAIECIRDQNLITYIRREEQYENPVSGIKKGQI